MSPDPGNAGADLFNPQSWNGYAYVMNSPLSNVDPDGLDSCTATNCLSMGQPPPQPGQVAGSGFGFSGGGFTLGGSYGSAPAVSSLSRPLPSLGASDANGNGFGDSFSPSNNGTQTFNQCMAAHANDFSIAGTLNHTYNAITGSNSLTFQNNFFAQAVLGNPLTSLAYGSATDNAGTAASLAPTIRRPCNSLARQIHP